MLRIDDRILAVDGHSVYGLSRADVMALLYKAAKEQRRAKIDVERIPTGQDNLLAGSTTVWGRNVGWLRLLFVPFPDSSSLLRQF